MMIQFDDGLAKFSNFGYTKKNRTIAIQTAGVKF